MSARWRYRVLELGGAMRGVKAEEMEALLNGAAADGWELQQVIQRENSNKFLAVFRKSRGREQETERGGRSKDSWIGDWGL
ncbi:MAG: DUF4177 domain-containing protein [Anaerolineales bacterium]|jgi:hypothetical protein